MSDGLEAKTDRVMQALSKMREASYADPQNYCRRLSPMGAALTLYLGFNMGWHEPTDEQTNYVLLLACLPCNVFMTKAVHPRMMESAVLTVGQMQREVEVMATVEWYNTVPQCSHIMAWQHYFAHWHEDTLNTHSVTRRRALEQWALEIHACRIWDNPT